MKIKIHTIIRRFKTWYKKTTCKHEVLTVVEIHYQEGYAKCKCDECGENVYQDF